MNAHRPALTRRRVLVAVLVVAIVGMAGIVWKGTWVSDRVHAVARRIELLVDPPPDRPIAGTVLITPRPATTPAPTPTAGTSAGPTASADPGTSTPSPTSTPLPQRVRVDVNLLAHPEKHFISEEYDHEWCAVAGTQMVLAMLGKAPLTLAFQKELASRIGEWESRRDSLNGGWGPGAMVAALKAYGVGGYQVRAYETRADALYDAAVAIETTHEPVMLLAWRGAHTWVMTGFRADGDPVVFSDAKVTGGYILDPWYPIYSSIWGYSDPPGTFENLSSMRENYLPWKRPEGHYPDRDGLFIAVVPTTPKGG
jgi:hypothetical protein